MGEKTTSNLGNENLPALPREAKSMDTVKHHPSKGSFLEG